MRWKNLRLGKKFAIGFGIILLFLAATAGWAVFGIGEIVGNANQVIAGNKLNGELAQKEVDHLNWLNRVSALLTDANITTLDVQTDDHKCGFGKWLYGEGRKEAEKLVPSLAPLFSKIEQPHKNLHKSAIAIGKNFKQADPHLPEFLAEKEVDHLKWVAEVNNLFLQNLPELIIITDDHECGLGKWLHGEGAKKVTQGNPVLASMVASLKEPHYKLHQTAIAIQEVYKPIHPGLTATLMNRLDDHRKWAARVSVALINEDNTLNVQTDPTRCAFGKFLASEEAVVWMRNFPQLKVALEAAVAPHNALHASAVEIESALQTGNRFEAMEVYKSLTVTALAQIDKLFKDVINAEAELTAARSKALDIFNTQTTVALVNTRDALSAVKKEANHLLEGAVKANEIFAD